MKKQYKHLLSILISLQLLGLPTTQAGWGSAVRRFFKKSQAETLKTVPHLGEQGLRSLNKSAHSFISEFGEDLSEKAARGDLSELIGRETDLAQSENILSSDLSLFIEGQPGVGVEDIVNGLVYKTVHHSDLIDPHLKGRRFININLDKFLAGTTNKRGTEQIMNGRLERLQKALEENPDHIYIFNNLGGLVQKAEEGDVQVRALFAKLEEIFNQNPKIQILTTGETKDFKKGMEKYSRLFRHLNNHTVHSPGIVDTAEIIHPRVAPLFLEAGVSLGPKSILTAAKIAAEYLPNLANPGATEKLLKQVAAQLRREARAKPQKLQDIEKMQKRLKGALAGVEGSTRASYVRQAKALSEKLAKVEEELAQLQMKWKDFEPQLRSVQKITDHIDQHIYYFSDVISRISQKQRISPKDIQKALSNVENIAKTHPSEGLEQAAEFARELGQYTDFGTDSAKDLLKELTEILTEETKIRMSWLYQTHGSEFIMRSEVDGKVIAQVAGQLSNTDWRMIHNGMESTEFLKFIEDSLWKEVVGQQHAIKRTMDVINSFFSGARRGKGAVGFINYQGLSRVGKTLMAQILGKTYGNGRGFYELAGGSIMQPHQFLSKVEGAPAGYKGYGETETLLDHVEKNPVSVILVDESEKMTPEGKNWFLDLQHNPIKLKPNGKPVDFSKVIFIWTSNSMAKMDVSEDIGVKELHSILGSIDPKLYTPEFLNRFDEIIVFRKFVKEEILDLVNRMWKFGFFPNLFEKSKIEIYLQPEAVSLIAVRSQGGDAKQIEYMLKNEVATKITELKKTNAVQPGDMVEVTVKSIKLEEAPAPEISQLSLFDEIKTTEQTQEVIDLVVHRDVDEFVQAQMHGEDTEQILDLLLEQ